MIEWVAENRLLLSLAGGALGGLLAGGLYAFARRMAPRVFPGALLGVFVLVGAFAGARLMLGGVTSPEIKPADEAGLNPVEAGPAPGKVTPPAVYPRGQIAPRSIDLLDGLASRDRVFAEALDAALDPQAAPERDVLVFAITEGASAAQTLIPYAEDQATLDLVESMAVMTQRLVSRDPKACYGWLYGGFGYQAFDFDAFLEAVGRPLLDYHLTAYADLVRSAGDSARATTTAGKTAADRATFAMMQTGGIERSGIILGERAPADGQDQRAACQARLALLRTVLADEEAAAGIRYLFAQP
ncbi:MAG: hypothetical protein AAFW83_05920 [Pseudomonadota bacterium]